MIGQDSFRSQTLLVIKRANLEILKQVYRGKRPVSSDIRFMNNEVLKLIVKKLCFFPLYTLT